VTALLDEDCYLICSGQVILGDKGLAGKQFEAHLKMLGATLIRPDRKGEPRRFGPLGGMRGSSRSSTRSKASSAWSVTVDAPRLGCSFASRNGCSRWLRGCGSTGNSTSLTNALSSPMTTKSDIGNNHLG
jgi:hypothetical protein